MSRKKVPSQFMPIAGLNLNTYNQMMIKLVSSLGGWYNGHGHLCRACTLDPIFLSHINITPLEASNFPLYVKQNLTGDLHRGLAYTEENLLQRMAQVLEMLIGFGTTRFDTCIDATSGIGNGGLLAIECALKLKEKYKDRIKLRIAPNPIFGFKEGTDRWEIYKEAAMMSDFLSALPEKDDYSFLSNRDGKIGFRRHLRRVIELGCETEKEIHIHLDQANRPDEAGTETLIEALGWNDDGWFDQPKISNHVGPSIWVIHMISPSGYSEKRFRRLANALKRHNIGVIVCPTAAISMRQLRPIEAPLHSSIARMLELCKIGVPVRIGSDNICDVFVPQGDGNMLTEILMAGHALRFAIPYVWAKLGAGHHLNKVDIATISRALQEDSKAFANIASNWESAVNGQE